MKEQIAKIIHDFIWQDNYEYIPKEDLDKLVSQILSLFQPTEEKREKIAEYIALIRGLGEWKTLPDKQTKDCGWACKEACYRFTDQILFLLFDQKQEVCPEIKEEMRIDACYWAELSSYPIPKGAIPQSVAVEKSGTIVVYGEPNEEHDCDLMGCPTFEHVLYIKHLTCNGTGNKE